VTTMDPKEAYRAVVAFLEDHWERRPVPGDFGDFYGMCTLMSDGGTYDRAMWWDWLAAIIKVQTGVTFPDPRHRYLGPDMVKPMNTDEAYAAMFEFIREYWERVSRPPEIGGLLDHMRYTPGTGTADPEMWKRWLAAVEKVQANR